MADKIDFDMNCCNSVNTQYKFEPSLNVSICAKLVPYIYALNDLQSGSRSILGGQSHLEKIWVSLFREIVCNAHFADAASICSLSFLSNSSTVMEWVKIGHTMS